VVFFRVVINYEISVRIYENRTVSTSNRTKYLLYDEFTCSGKVCCLLVTWKSRSSSEKNIEDLSVPSCPQTFGDNDIVVARIEIPTSITAGYRYWSVNTIPSGRRFNGLYEVSSLRHIWPALCSYMVLSLSRYGVPEKITPNMTSQTARYNGTDQLFPVWCIWSTLPYLFHQDASK